MALTLWAIEYFEIVPPIFLCDSVPLLRIRPPSRTDVMDFMNDLLPNQSAVLCRLALFLWSLSSPSTVDRFGTDQLGRCFSIVKYKYRYVSSGLMRIEAYSMWYIAYPNWKVKILILREKDRRDDPRLVNWVVSHSIWCLGECCLFPCWED